MAAMGWVCIGSCLTIILFFTVQGSQKNQFKRKLHTEFRCTNGSCVNGSCPNVAYTKAVGLNDTLHYVLSTVGIPTLLVVRTATGSDININCKNLLSSKIEDIKESITFSEEGSLYTHAVMFNRLLEYNDTNDVADLTKIGTDPSLWHVYDLQDLPWSNSSDISDLSENLVTIKVAQNTENLSFRSNGSISFQFQMFDRDGREDDLPHLEFNANSTQFSLVLDNINTSFTASRFALEMIIVTSDNENWTANKMSHHFIDDEHAPGQFEMMDWTFGDMKQPQGAFLQWKPVSYLKPDRNFKTATKTKDYDLENFNMTKFKHQPSVAYAFFGDSLFNGSMATSITNVSFGLKDDKFYVLNHYTAWTASLGYGNPPLDTVSALVIIVISVGLGLPVIIIIFGGIGVCVKKNRDKRREDLTTSYSAVQ